MKAELYGVFEHAGFSSYHYYTDRNPRSGREWLGYRRANRKAERESAVKYRAEQEAMWERQDRAEALAAAEADLAEYRASQE